MGLRLLSVRTGRGSALAARARLLPGRPCGQTPPGTSIRPARDRSHSSTEATWSRNGVPVVAGAMSLITASKGERARLSRPRGLGLESKHILLKDDGSRQRGGDGLQVHGDEQPSGADAA